MDILLIAGLWLDGSAWDDVVPELTALGHSPVPLTLPGQGDGTASATLDDQLATVLAAVDAVPGKPLVMGHSATSSLAWPTADARPEKVVEEWIAAGDIPGLARAAHLEYVDLDPGLGRA
ncbi:alpha/beta fold hydrolase [Nocardiopsis alba]|uniref:alpha/beta fold hydrolase n=1 Tax=Nocardiopsis alba TaxID=53437 RepID=UPI0033E56BDA